MRAASYGGDPPLDLCYVLGIPVFKVRSLISRLIVI